MSALKLRKVGNSLGVIFPKELQEALNVADGDMIDATLLENHQVMLTAHLPHHSQWSFNKSKLTPEDKSWLNADLEGDDESPGW